VWISARRGAAALLAAAALLPAAASAAPVETVTSTADAGPGSLRQAIADVDPGGTVEFADGLAGTIELVSGEIAIGKALTIDGPGARVLDVSGGDSSRIFHIDTAGDVAISGLTLRDGFADDGSPNGPMGGAVLKLGDGALALSDMQLLDSTAIGLGSAGGALFASDSAGELVLERVTVAGNQANGSGGGLFVRGRPATLRNVTIADNHAGGSGGGVQLQEFAVGVDFSLVNVTVAGNSAGVHGGGLVRDNVVIGIGSIELVNSVVADNTAEDSPDCLAPDPVTLVGATLIEDASNCDTDGSGTLITGQDPQLGELVWNEPGETMTMALAAGSPAIDAGGACPPPATDQRGIARPQGPGCDLGAFERVPGQVTNLADSGPGSLRQTIADVDPGGTVEFADGLAGTIELVSGEIAFDKPLTIDGPGARELAVSGTESSRVFNIESAGDVAISGLTLTDGFADAGSPIGPLGGAVYTRSHGALALTDVQLLDSTAVGAGSGGGALFADASGGELVLERVTVAGNQADGAGGGLFVFERPATLRNVTIADNHAGADGGGVHLLDLIGSVDFSLVNTTVAGNSAGVGGGLMAQTFGGGSIELVNSVVANNTAGTGDDCATPDPVTLVGAALIEDTSACPTDGSGTLIDGQDPQLGALASNAPGATMTMAVTAGSPALDAAPGDGGGACPPPATDQRGIARPQGTGCDLGAYEARPAVAALDSPGHDFGDLEVGQGPSGPAQFTVSNDAAAELDLLVNTVALSGDDADQFALDTSDCDDGSAGPPVGRVAPGESCTVEVRFDPTVAGEKQATLELDTSGGNLSATLEGTGEAPPAPDPPTPPDPPAPDPPAPPAPDPPPARSPALERLTVASRCVSPSRSGRVQVELALRMARPAPVQLRIERAVGTKARSTCPTRGKPRRFTGRFRTVKTYARARTRPVAAAVTRRITLNLRLVPGLYRITARAHTPGGRLSKPKRRFVRVLG
jgi:uncharacterized protein YkvS